MPDPSMLLKAWLGEHPWLAVQLSRIAAGDTRALFLAMGQAGRQVGRQNLGADRAAAHAARPGWDPAAWSRDQAARSLLVLAIPADDGWLGLLDRVFHAGTVEELVALYQTLPLFPRPELLAARAAEGIRSSMLPVFLAVALDNPYPAESLDDHAFNQMVLKAFFVGADVDRIAGLARRRNADLGRMLADYARERRAAGRSIDARLLPLAEACLQGTPHDH